MRTSVCTNLCMHMLLFCITANILYSCITCCGESNPWKAATPAQLPTLYVGGLRSSSSSSDTNLWSRAAMVLSKICRDNDRDAPYFVDKPRTVAVMNHICFSFTFHCLT
ncbi:hypothetical protein KP509_36G020100 [Ceratopteris richardii]|uniref:Secreted protein n=1 Tax=Ceratopteris richardii TaxID=49495 RepID=A0A8T2QBM5_CERRI|nr:hypothetical protein KP509_36G020100 [Ceratopteris richardii]